LYNGLLKSGDKWVLRKEAKAAVKRAEIIKVED
jgi:hypothetical protein